MAEMEFLKTNILDTTTMLTIDSGTGTSQYLFNRNTKLGYSSVGYNSTTATTIIVTFNSTTPVSHILLQGHNLKQFELFYDTQTAGHTLASYTTNSETSTYISFSTVSAANIQLKMTDTIQGSVEKNVGEFIITERQMVFTRNPNAALYNPFIDRKQIEHEMPDGGTILFNVKDKFKAKIGLRYISTSFYNSLLSIYEDADALYFVPFPTTTSWNGKAYHVVWRGGFDFKFVDNVKNYYSGNILLKETASG